MLIARPTDGLSDALVKLQQIYIDHIGSQVVPPNMRHSRTGGPSIVDIHGMMKYGLDMDDEDILWEQSLKISLERSTVQFSIETAEPRAARTEAHRPVTEDLSAVR